jgi:hypothetical protein
VPYSASPPAFVQRTAADGIVVANTLVLNGTGNLNPIVDAKEIRGGLHRVEYLEYLNENSYRGVSIARREVGMLAYVQRQWNNGADAVLGKLYQLKALAGNGVGTWEVFEGGGSTVTPNNTYPVADIAGRDALPNLVAGDIAIVADAAGDASEVPALEGGATYIYTGGTPLWLRFLYPEDPRLDQAHAQNTDTALVVEVAGLGNVVLLSRTIYDHLNDADIHFRINDGNAAGSLSEVYSSRKARETFLARNPVGSATKFFNERGEAVEVNAQVTITRINGGTASTIF